MNPKLLYYLYITSLNLSKKIVKRSIGRITMNFNGAYIDINDLVVSSANCKRRELSNNYENEVSFFISAGNTLPSLKYIYIPFTYWNIGR